MLRKLRLSQTNGFLTKKLVFKLLCVSNFTLNEQFWFFGPNFPKKLFSVNKWKSEPHHWIPYVQISLGTKFLLKWQFWSFWPNLPKNCFTGLKEKQWTPYIFYIIVHIQINLVQNFSSNWQFDFLDKICPERYFQSKAEKWTSPWNFAYLNYSRYKISS